ncbi:hypothetical protein QWZ06_06850 [Chryseobacterium tructae]|uniref:Uncharacterized protein n=1 Tax=Chryseobacterium tructae TaxID=1037380 RepID=A0ABV7XWY8_9FLAO|nr:hypothetical protein [Chryseobacterium tructae]MDN3691990.1 hypothetical protein [Chryseobacterium tructae]
MKKAIIYVILFIIYCLLAFPIAGIDNMLNLHNFYLVTGLGFGILNSIIAFIILKWKSSFNITIGFVIAFISLSTAYLLLELHWVPNWDSIGMMTAIVGNAVTSIILWETAFWIKKKYASYH